MIRRDNIYLSIAAALLVTPASFMLTAYWLTHDPTLRPLGITHESLASAGLVESGGTILTTVNLGPGVTLPMPRTEFEDSVNRAFDLHGLKSRFAYVTDAAAAGINIVYSVGKSQVGAYSLHRAAEGIRPTAEAHRLALRHARAKKAANDRRLDWKQRIFAE